MWGETETAGGETVATQVFRRGVIKVRRQLSIIFYLIIDTFIIIRLSL